MKVLLFHNETQFFAGAEKVLGYFAAGAGLNRDLKLALAYAPGGKMDDVARLFPERFPVAGGEGQSPVRMLRNAFVLARIARRFRADVLHAWAARDWETAALAGRMVGLPVVATLHDHPTAAFISFRRQRLMRWAIWAGVRRLICVSEAVRQACLAAGYPANRLVVVPNGLPPQPDLPREFSSPIKLGFLGAFTQRKGFGELFKLVDCLDGTNSQWRLRIAGGPMGVESEALLHQIQERYQHSPWWSRVEFVGWTDQPMAFLRGVDLLVVPSSEFDPYPTVLLEAAWSGLPVFAAEVGGVPEIVLPHETGVLFDPRNIEEAAMSLDQMLDPVRLQETGANARQRAERCFGVDAMVAAYSGLYSKV